MSILKLRGLPWSCTTDDIIKFMDGVHICANPDEGDKGKRAIYMMTNSDGRPSGEAFIKVESETDVDIACDKNNALMGQRYIEVFRSNEDQLNKHLNESTNNSQNWRDPIVRLRGLPYGCEKKDILMFFDGLSTSEEEIMMVIDFSGRFNGEAFVQFGNLCDALKALDKHKQKISNRYIEVFRSTFIEMDHYQNGTDSRGSSSRAHGNSSGGYNSNRGGGYNNMRGGGAGSYGGRNDRAKPYSRYNNDGNNFNRNRNGGGSGGGGYNNYNEDNGGGYVSKPRPLMNNRGGGTGRGSYNNHGNSNYNNNYNDNCYDEYNSNNNSGYNDYNENYNDNYGIDDYSITVHGIKVRGLPFQASERDIREFFAPLKPSNIIITRGRDGRPTGEGEVDFATHDDALKGMEKDKKYMGKRYLELFLLSEPGNDQPPRHHPGPGAVTPPETLSLGSLMNKNFTSVPQQPPTNSLYTNFDSYSTAKPVPPPVGMLNQPPLPTIPPAPAADTSSTYSTNINELLMAEMAQKMFQSAYSHFQATHQTQQGHQAPAGYSQQSHQQQAPQRRY